MNTSVKWKATLSRGTDKRATSKQVYDDIMDGRVPHSNIALGRSEIDSCTASVVCMEVYKNMEGKSLTVTSFKDLVDLLMFSVYPAESKDVY